MINVLWSAWLYKRSNVEKMRKKELKRKQLNIYTMKEFVKGEKTWILKLKKKNIENP